MRDAVRIKGNDFYCLRVSFIFSTGMTTQYKKYVKNGFFFKYEHFFYEKVGPVVDCKIVLYLNVFGCEIFY